MGRYINRKMVIDEDTGELLKVNNWIGYDGFNSKGYKYRNKSAHIRYFYDSIPPNLSEGAYRLLMQLAEMANEDNALVRRVERKSKFSNIIYKPLEAEEIRMRLKYKMGICNFQKYWRELKKNCIKQIRYHKYLTWFINPAIIIKGAYVPYWLYWEFREYMNPYLSSMAVKKLEDKVQELYYDDFAADGSLSEFDN